MLKKYLPLMFTLCAGTVWASPVAAPKLGQRAAVACPPLTTGTPHEAQLCWSTSSGITTLYVGAGSCPANGVGSLSYTAVDTSTSLAGTYLYTAVSAATTYCAYGTATVGASVSPPSNTVQFTIPVYPPTGLGCAPSVTSAICTWTASTDPGTTVTVLDSAGACGASGQTFSTAAFGVTAGGPYTLAGLTAGDTYCVELAAVIGGVTSADSGTFQFSISAVSPSIEVVVQ